MPYLSLFLTFIIIISYFLIIFSIIVLIVQSYLTISALLIASITPFNIIITRKLLSNCQLIVA